MSEENIAGIALRDVVTLGGQVRDKVGDLPDAQHQYWEWLASSTLGLGFRLIESREGVDAARDWLSRAFVSFSALLKEQGHDIRILIARGE